MPTDNIIVLLCQFILTENLISLASFNSMHYNLFKLGYPVCQTVVEKYIAYSLIYKCMFEIDLKLTY